MRIFNILFIFISLILISTSCGPNDNDTITNEDESKGNISIMVLDDSTKSLIPYVSIKLGRDYRTWSATGENGIAILINVPVGDYDAEFYAAKYEKHVEKIKIEETDQELDVFMKRNAVIDIIPPKIIGGEVNNPKIFLLFNEGMNRQSVMNAIQRIGWSYSYYDELFNREIEIRTSDFIKTWKGDNLLIIEPPDDENEWSLDKFTLVGGVAFDHSGNILQDGWSY